ncbi:hypothetical protein GCM10007972_11720 [Iodidimonas muriae]|uniref:DUF3617 family protein n=1 Tax=Iodidimonas muriae TaxID=261467 RepID=A0ABQ2LBX1_9PROT|nr:hypothetical protein [Iodidimonas muriae]GER06841.1 hypothetical protein JCM17843_11510 [Kordiimonadales bacterium JCM 17843]GGO09810.1 hypothetical protein GCM10007972_11720 [Iodidimonas muriae]
MGMRGGFVLALFVALAFGLAACNGAGSNPPPVQRLEDIRLSAWQNSGATKACLPPVPIVEMAVIDLNTITFQLADDSLWRNDLPQVCPGLMMSESFDIRAKAETLCRTDMVQVKSPDGPGALCGLGLFERLDPRPEQM